MSEKTYKEFYNAVKKILSSNSKEPLNEIITLVKSTKIADGTGEKHADSRKK